LLFYLAFLITIFLKMIEKEDDLIFEMEQSACLAVAKFRHFSYGAIIYAGEMFLKIFTISANRERKSLSVIS
jgi:hypothetical protein